MSHQIYTRIEDSFWKLSLHQGISSFYYQPPTTVKMHNYWIKPYIFPFNLTYEIVSTRETHLFINLIFNSANTYSYIEDNKQTRKNTNAQVLSIAIAPYYHSWIVFQNCSSQSSNGILTNRFHTDKDPKWKNESLFS